MSTPSDQPGDPTDLPLRPELRGQVPYGAPQLDVAHRLNVNENPYPPSAAMVSDVASAVAGATTDLNRYPDRDATALRADLAAYIRTDVPNGPAVTGEQVWAANGSNEVMIQLLQAFGGPGRVALSFAPTYSMYPDYARTAFTGYQTLPRRDDFTVDLDAALDHIAAHQPAVILLASPNNPTGTALSLGDIDALCTASRGMVVVDEAYAEFRRPGHALGDRASRGPSASGGDAHDEQGVRPGRGPTGIPGGQPTGRGRRPARAPALPPVSGHPGRRPHRAAACHGAAGFGGCPA